jgi:MOSC domain-containing protein YiiM
LTVIARIFSCRIGVSNFDEVRMPRLLSVNVGLPQDVTWNGKTVRTAVGKSPVTGRRMVRKLDVDGDAQGALAGHGGEQRAVFV